MSGDTICATFLPFSPEEVTVGFNEFFPNLPLMPPDDFMKDCQFTDLVINTTKSENRNAKGKTRLYDCPHCSTTLYNASNLQSHIRTHTGEKPFKCHICGFSCNQSSNLKGHMRTHTGEKPFKCTVCDKMFARTSHLIGHQRIHTGDMPFECKLCTKKFYTSTRLKKHQKEKHLDVSISFCGICEESFVNDKALELHLLIHNGERPFKCSICSAAFRSKEDLKIHTKLHVGTPHKYECPKCCQKFQIKICCERHFANCPSDLEQKPVKTRIIDNLLEGDIEISSEPLESNVASSEVIIHLAEEPIEYLTTSDESSLNSGELTINSEQTTTVSELNSEQTIMDSKQLVNISVKSEHNVRNALTFQELQQYIVPDVFDIQFKQEQDDELAVFF